MGEKSLVRDATVIALYLDIIKSPYKAYYVFGREADLDTYKGTWSNGESEIKKCFARIKDDLTRLEKPWREIARANDIKSKLPLSRIMGELGKAI